ncbi:MULTISPECIES: hypothetical protein [unclassified Rhizobium]|uniref:hypothetical protein n=1 Tax=unclassified Rhizobium TaxID=2613769 RepID=UPI0007EAFA72|nr:MULTISPECIES: hypothetical protein [unclassified Rhizobium]ANL11983.1 hypothetical protein AMJ98_PA00037 [Rhizobium sp. N1341]ANM42828.1 hypothetical protein AMK03_PA00037 [Rhizobium sp. N741]
MKFGGSSGGGGFDNDDERNKKSAAASRGSYTPSYDMKGGSAYVGGQSREADSQQAYVRDAASTMPKQSRHEQARTDGVIQEANAIKAKEAAEGKTQHGQQADQKQEKKANIHDTPQAMARQEHLASRLRGRMDALEAGGLQKFEERKPITSEKNFEAARSSYQATKEGIKQGKFAEMADRAQSAAGDQQQRGQSAEASRPANRFAGMADRATAAANTTPQKGTDTKKDTGMEQG